MVEIMAVRRSNAVERHKWREEEELQLLAFVKEQTMKGTEFEKPSASTYYKKFKQQTRDADMKKLPLDKIVMRMRNFKRSYQAVQKWRIETGQGLLDAAEGSDEENKNAVLRSITDYMAGHCKHFHILDELFNGKLVYKQPYLISSIDGGQVMELTYDMDDSVHVVESPSVEMDDDGAVDYEEESTLKTSPTEEASKNMWNTPVKSAAVAFEKAAKYWLEVNTNRLEWEKKCKEEERVLQGQMQQQELEFKRSMLEVERKKLQMKEEHWKKNQELKETKANRAFELEKQKLELEHQRDILRIEKEFELQKLKIMEKKFGNE